MSTNGIARVSRGRKGKTKALEKGCITGQRSYIFFKSKQPRIMEYSVKVSMIKSHAKSLIKSALKFDNGVDFTSDWKTLRDVLIPEREQPIIKLWTGDTHFRWGFFRVCSIVDVSIQLTYNWLSEEKDAENNRAVDQLVNDFLSDSCVGADGDYKSTLKILDALQIISADRDRYELEEEDILSYQITFKTIAEAQLTVLNAVRKQKAVMEAA